MTINVRLSPNLIAGNIVDSLVSERVASRLANSDPTLWGEHAAERAKQRLGWVDAVSRVEEVLERALSLAEVMRDVDYDRVLLCGMGGSSLAPQVMSVGARLPLIPVDTLHPDRINELLSIEALRRAVIVVSSKSGTTVETRAQLSFVEERLRKAGIESRDRIIAITDPGSDLATHAQSAGYRVVLADPTVGGRYSALIEFGLVPSALAGANLEDVTEEAQAALRQCSIDETSNPMLQVAASLAQVASRSITVQFVEDGLPFLPAWIEQLIAESTGHEGQGILPLPRLSHHVSRTAGPVVEVRSHEPRDPVTHRDGIDVLSVAGALPAQFVFWELVTATVSSVLGINPFEQPDVERTKATARKLNPDDIPTTSDVELSPGLFLTNTATPVEASLDGLASAIIKHARASTYVVFQAFLSAPSALLERLARRVETVTGVPSTVSYGPQYLHSTGQLHKGGPSGGFFVNILEDASVELPVPGQDASFNWLNRAAARADLHVLEGLGRAAVAMRLSNEQALDPLIREIEGSPIST